MGEKQLDRKNAAKQSPIAPRRNGFDHLRLASEFKSDVLAGFPYIYKNGGLASFFGSSRIKEDHPYYKAAVECAYLIGKEKAVGNAGGGGPGIMEAGTVGAVDAGVLAIGIQPRFLGEVEKQAEIPGIERIDVHSMHSRKILMSANSAGLVFFPGGFGTLDELFDYLTLIQLGKHEQIPIILYDSKFWKGMMDFLHGAVRQGMIGKELIDSLVLADNPRQVAGVIEKTKRARIDSYVLAKMFKDDLVSAYNATKHINNTVIGVFGSARTKENEVRYAIAENSSAMLAAEGYVIYSGGGSGIMDAAHTGAHAVGAESFGFLPLFLYELERPDTTNHTHVPLYLMSSRKVVMGTSDALIIHPGGIGTLDEMFEYAVRMQIGDMPKKPLVCVEYNYWAPLVKWLYDAPIHEGLISASDMNLFSFAETPSEIRERLQK